jgi:hypothetical protein
VHRQYMYAYASTSRINGTLRILGSRPIRSLPRTSRCAICALSKSRKLKVPRTSDDATLVPLHSTCQCDLCRELNAILDTLEPSRKVTLSATTCLVVSTVPHWQATTIWL